MNIGSIVEYRGLFEEMYFTGTCEILVPVRTKSELGSKTIIEGYKVTQTKVPIRIRTRSSPGTKNPKTNIVDTEGEIFARFRYNQPDLSDNVIIRFANSDHSVRLQNDAEIDSKIFRKALLTKLDTRVQTIL